MSKRKKYLDNRQVEIDFDQPIERYARLRTELIQAAPATSAADYTYEEIGIQIAAAVKRAIHSSGLSREEVCIAVNRYYGWPHDDRRKNLSIHMLNNHLCKPEEYPFPAPLIHAIQRVTGSFEPLAVLAETEGAKIIVGD